MKTNYHTNLDDRPTSDAPRIRFSEKFAAPYLEKRTMILEIGCGIGSYTRLIDRSGCIALDIDINAIKIAKKYCINTEFIVGSGLNLPFKKEIFNLICIWAVLEEIAAGTEKQMVAEIQRKTLMSNAVFLLSAYNDHILCEILDPAYVFRGFRHYNLNSLSRFYYYFEHKGISELGVTAISSGFHILSMTYFIYRTLTKRQDIQVTIRAHIHIRYSTKARSKY